MCWIIPAGTVSTWLPDCILHYARLVADLFCRKQIEIEAFVADEHFHRLYGDGADSIREVFEHRIFEHFDCLLRIPKPSFRILNRLSVFVVDDNLRLLDLFIELGTTTKPGRSIARWSESGDYCKNP